MAKYNNLFKTIKGNSPDAIAMDIQHYAILGYYIQGGQIHSHNKLKSLIPFRMETEYTVFMQKTVEVEVEPASDEE